MLFAGIHKSGCVFLSLQAVTDADLGSATGAGHVQSPGPCPAAAGQHADDAVQPPCAAAHAAAAAVAAHAATDPAATTAAAADISGTGSDGAHCSPASATVTTAAVSLVFFVCLKRGVCVCICTYVCVCVCVCVCVHLCFCMCLSGHACICIRASMLLEYSDLLARWFDVVYAVEKSLCNPSFTCKNNVKPQRPFTCFFPYTLI